MHKRLPQIKRLWITDATKNITHVAEVNTPTQHADYINNGITLLLWKYRFIRFYKLDNPLPLFPEAIPDLKEQMYHIPDHDIAVPTTCLWSAEDFRP